ncbi:MAG: hypothetical protein ACFFCP_10480 [Promethearchaeota archaeon]
MFDFTDIFGNVFGTFTLMLIILPVIFVVIVIIIFVTVCRAGSGVAQSVARGFTLEAPSFVIPQRHRGHQRSDGSEIRTVRLPERCPSCGAALSQEGIDWTGPLEAQCSYCGGTVRATFERV